MVGLGLFQLQKENTPSVKDKLVIYVNGVVRISIIGLITFDVISS